MCRWLMNYSYTMKGVFTYTIVTFFDAVSKRQFL